MPASIIMLLSSAVLGIIALAFGIAADNGILFGLGVADAFLSLLLTPVVYLRVNKRRRIFARQDAQLIWQYQPYEAVHIATATAKKVRQSSVGLSILACICLAVIFAPFIVIIEDISTKYLLLYIAIIAALLPFNSLWIAPAMTVRLITRVPSVTIIGRDYILINNRYIGINDRASLTLVDAVVKTGSGMTLGCGSALFLTYTFLMRYGNIMHFTVEVPIPGNRHAEAVRFAESWKTAP